MLLRLWRPRARIFIRARHSLPSTNLLFAASTARSDLASGSRRIRSVARMRVNASVIARQRPLANGLDDFFSEGNKRATQPELHVRTTVTLQPCTRFIVMTDELALRIRCSDGE